MPSAMKRAHNVYHVSKLKPYHTPDGQKGSLSIIIDPEGNKEDAVFAILEIPLQLPTTTELLLRNL